MKPVIKYTVPNLAIMKQRGSLGSRSGSLLSLNETLNSRDFELVEVPGDFIKNASEEIRTGLQVGSMILDGATAHALYSDESGDPTTPVASYVLHTEPALSRRGTIRITPALRWYDPGWVDLFLRHVLTIVDCLGRPPYAVELHPGYSQRGQNTLAAIAEGTKRVHCELSDQFGSSVQVFIENRTGQTMRTGLQMRQLWEDLAERCPSLAQVCGFVVDLQQLYTTTRAQFLAELAEVPAESISGYHIHRLHHEPSLDDPIPWGEAARLLAMVQRPLHILPEVHHREQLLATHRFCKEVLGL
jgi:hypothetical protein